MSDQENAIVVKEDDENTEDRVESNFTIDKETVLEAERVMKEGLPDIEQTFRRIRKTFFQSAIIRTGVVLVTLKAVTIAGNIFTERMCENKKTEEK